MPESGYSMHKPTSTSTLTESLKVQARERSSAHRFDCMCGMIQRFACTAHTHAPAEPMPRQPPLLTVRGWQLSPLPLQARNRAHFHAQTYSCVPAEPMPWQPPLLTVTGWPASLSHWPRWATLQGH
eukprot:1154496-Pelagomonas_calceolata.AAC.3